MSNLLQNAFEFTPAKGHVKLDVRVTKERVFIDVEDQCGGLADGQITRMFEPFTQASEDRSGLGLGLSIARRGVEAMNGQLSVHDKPGHGCVFALALSL